MLFDSYIFIFCFLPITLFGYYLFTRSKKYYVAISWLVLASLFFYGWWDPKYLILLITSISVNYVLGYTLWKRYQQQKDNSLLLFCSIFVNLLFIGYFKYAYFLVSNLNIFINDPIAFDPIILPLGISFFTFQKIAFLVDASKGEIKDYRFSDYCLFVTFFPQLIAGPIVQHKQIIPQLEKPENLKISTKTLSVGLTLFIMGLCKKIALADSIAPFANAVFAAPLNGVALSFWESWCGALAYSLQLYFDFSGYSDMAIGLAYLFGITLPINFYSPYKATSIIDFWHRWHMTLSAFLRTYLYIPLGGNRNGSFRRYLNLVITMLLGGLWHGANWTFVIWGALHGFYLTVNHFWRHYFPNMRGGVYRLLAQALTLFAVIVAWVPFRAENIFVAKSMLTSMLSTQHFTMPSMFSSQAKGLFYNGLADWKMGIAWIFGLCVIALWAPNSLQLMQHHFKNDNRLDNSSSAIAWKPSTLWAFSMALVMLLCFMLISDDSEFLYFQF